MSARVSLVRRVAGGIVLRLLKAAPRAGGEDGAEWRLAMAAEVEAIEDDWAALWFAIGCWAAVLRVYGVLVLARRGLAVCVAGWAGVKLYLAIWLMRITGDGRLDAELDWLVGCAVIAGLGYGVAGLGLLLGRVRLMAAGFVCALLINGAIYGAAIITRAEPAFWLMALVGEDYFVWTFALLGLGAVIWFEGRGARAVI